MANRTGEPRTGSRAEPGAESRGDGPLDRAAHGLDRLLRPLNRLASSRLVRTLLPIAILGVAAWLIEKEVKAVSWAQLLHGLASTPPWALGLSVLFTIADYACLAALEWYALDFLGHRLPLGRVTLAASGATAMSNAMGFGLASGTAVRLRLYSFAGLTAADVAKVTALLSAVVFASSIVALGAGGLLGLPTVSRELGWPAWAVAALGALLLTPAVGWFVLVRRFARDHPTAPSRTGRAIVLAAGVGNWLFQAAALFVLSAHSPAGFPALLAAFCLGGLIGSTVGVPADLGVLEAAVIGSGAMGPAHQAAAALILFRLVFHVTPLVIATAAMSARQMAKLVRPKR